MSRVIDDEEYLELHRQLAQCEKEGEQMSATIVLLRRSLEDMTKRVESSWERRDFAPDSDLEAVRAARAILAAG